MPLRLLIAGVLLLSAGRGGTAAERIRVTIAARALQPGELVVLTIATAPPVESLHVRAFDRDVTPFRLDKETWRALVGIDLAVPAGSHVVSIDAGPSMRTDYILHVRAKRFATRSLSVDEAFVNPPPAVQARIEREAADLAQIWSASQAERLWTSPFVRPVPDAANSSFGTRSVFNGQPRSPHGGADFLSPAGTPIKAPGAGRIVLARGLYFTGNTVIVDHGLGLFSMLAHLSRIDVREGERVTAGQVVGLVGATGRVTGPHLHWAVRAGGARVDPLSLLALLGKN